MSMSIENSPTPSFKSELITPAENDSFKNIKVTPLQLVADLQCVLGFRGSEKEKYSVEVSLGNQKQNLGRSVKEDNPGPTTPSSLLE